MAAASVQAGTVKVRPHTSALICCHSPLRAPPPREATVRTGHPSPSSRAKKSRSRKATDSMTLRAKWARVVDRVAPKKTARASGQASGSTLPARKGRNTSPSLPQGTLAAWASRAA